MRELTYNEMSDVSGGFGLLSIPAAVGLLVSIPTIVFGAITGPFTLGAGFAVMAAGIVGTSLAGAAMIVSICTPVL
ncbi:hypothetical protein [Klebsiella aerogenes]|jgi:hypothetical protein|uniref:hypothetical protein n=1 Tax=Klebsiella aerogenes TaxID=548 RepID=UPI00063C994A|nr:hypothetical protein [Klebsiella aerogenes]EKV7119437.1 hypothetical protein [Klebsiella aerogenes]EKZ9890110.1 hypothetical protein [Klebsiella aerogenes]KLE79343.1 hypothetical protein YA21_14885 [Klebsiella aerogenes]KTI98258.1 hypothetical protein ASU92_15690 [Klebsiella aerogenes]WHB01359.1 hypothetical protein HZS33_016170 [Klebsiella aerogenes]